MQMNTLEHQSVISFDIHFMWICKLALVNSKIDLVLDNWVNADHQTTCLDCKHDFVNWKVDELPEFITCKFMQLGQVEVKSYMDDI